VSGGQFISLKISQNSTSKEHIYLVRELVARRFIELAELFGPVWGYMISCKFMIIGFRQRGQKKI